MNFRIWIIILTIGFLFPFCLTADPIPDDVEPIFNVDPELYFLTFANSPQANGMGTCAINMVGDQSALYNPGALGVFHLSKNFSISSPLKTKWLPDVQDDLRLKTFNLSVGVTLNQLKPHPSRKFNCGIGIAYSVIDMDYGVILFRDESNIITGLYETPNKASLYTFSTALDYYIKVGFGYTIKKLKSKLDYNGRGEPDYNWDTSLDMHDYGMYVAVPLARFINKPSAAESSDNNSHTYELTPSFAYVKSNIGDSITYDYRPEDSRVYPAPETTRTGFSLYGAVKRGSMMLASANLSREIETYNFQDDEKLNKWGIELGILDILFVRYGGFSDDDASASEGRDITSYGVGFSFGGALNWLIASNKLRPADNLKGYILRNIDLRFDYAHYTGTELQGLDGTKFFKLSLSF